MAQQPLNNRVAIANNDGTPTDYFIRLLQGRGNTLDGKVSYAEAEQLVADGIAEWANNRDIIAGVGLSGGGNLSSDVTIDLDASLGDLNDVDLSTPATDGQVLAWDDASNKWTPVDQSGGGSTTPKSNRWRLYITTKQSSSSWQAIREMDMREIPGGANLAVGGIASASISDSANPPLRAFDGNLSTFWSSGGTAVPLWLEYQFVQPTYINELVIAGAPSASDNFLAAQVQYWDGAAWVFAWGISTTNWTSNLTRTFTNPFPVLPDTGKPLIYDTMNAVTSAGATGFGCKGALIIPSKTAIVHALVFRFTPETGATAGYDAQVVTLDGSNNVLSIVATSNLPTTGLGTAQTNVEFPFSSPVVLSAGVRYGLLLTRRTVSGAANFTVLGCNASTPLLNTGLVYCDTYVRAAVNQVTVGLALTSGSSPYWVATKVEVS